MEDCEDWSYRGGVGGGEMVIFKSKNVVVGVERIPSVIFQIDSSHLF